MSITNAPIGGMMPIINLLAFHSQLLPRAARRTFSFRSMKSSFSIIELFLSDNREQGFDLLLQELILLS